MKQIELQETQENMGETDPSLPPRSAEHASFDQRQRRKEREREGKKV